MDETENQSAVLLFLYCFTFYPTQYFFRVRFFGRPYYTNEAAIFINHKLLEVPFDGSVKDSVFGFWKSAICKLGPYHLQLTEIFRHQRESNPIILLVQNSLISLFVAGFLLFKVVCRKSNYDIKFCIFIFLIKSF